MFSSIYLRAVLLLGAAASLPAASFDFDSLPTGAAVPFSSTNGGLTATFSSPDGPGVFLITPTFAVLNLTGQALFDNDAPLHPLDVTFSSPISYVTLSFALNTSQTGTFFLNAFLGADAVGSTSATGVVVRGSAFPEGTISFQGVLFDRMRLTASSPDFMVDNINTVPEPGSLSLMIAGAAALLVARRKLLA